MTEFTLQAEIRNELGTGASRRLRGTGKFPAIIYGNEKDPILLMLDHDKVLHAIEKEGFYDAVLTIKVGKNSEKVKIKALQRHPFKPKLLHADFMRI